MRVNNTASNFGNLLLMEEGGNVGIGTPSPSFPLHMGSGAHVTAGGVWTDASSREYKENIEALSSDASLEALGELEPVTYTYKVDKGERHVGFIAEDVPSLVAMNDRKGLAAIEIAAVLTKVAQVQQQEIAKLKAHNDRLAGEIKELKAAVKALAARPKAGKEQVR